MLLIGQPTRGVDIGAIEYIHQQIIAMRDARKSDPHVPDVDDDQTRLGLSESLLIKALARGAILEWEGVVQPDSDIVEPISDQNIADLMDIWFVAQEFWKQYTAALSLLDAEGNSSRLAPNGTSAAGQDIAESATTNNSPVAEGSAAQPPESLALTS